MNPNSVLSINAVEGFPLEDFSIEAVRSQIAESQKVASGNGSAHEIAEANIEIEVSHTIPYRAIPRQTSCVDWHKRTNLLTGKINIGSGESAGCAQVIHRMDAFADL